MTSARLFIEAGCILGEGPLWHHLRQELFYVDIRRNTLYAASADGEPAGSWTFEQTVSAIALVDAERLIVAAAGALWHLNVVTGDRREMVALEADRPGNRPNDGRVNAAGGFWIGTMRDDEAPGGGFIYQYRLGGIERLVSGVGVPNSICFSPLGDRAYYTDTPSKRIMTCPLDPQTGRPAGAWSLFAEVTDRGAPDGAAVDAEGFVWSARWGGSCVVRHAPDGSVDAIVEVPVENVTCPALGGADFRTLFVTTAQQGLSAEKRAAQPQAGSIFAIEVEVPGFPQPMVAL